MNVLPNRVVEVGSECQDPRLLVPTKGLKGLYATLSYCWGKLENEASFLTARGNVKERESQTKLDSMPKTHLDAVRFTRSLGLQYIWIDALCI